MSVIPRAAIRRVVSRHSGAPAPRRIVALGRGGDHECYLLDGRLVLRRATREGPGVEREARLLGLVAEISPLPVPHPVFADAEDGWLAYEWLDGVPLLGRRPHSPEAVAAQLGDLLRALNAVEAGRLAGLADVDEPDHGALLRDARRDYRAVSPVLPARHRGAVEAFLATTPPPAAARLAFSHNDLGVEHVLVDPATHEITGVIDWSDAALTDPARDFGLLHRDLGPRALDAALAAAGGGGPALRARALFQARCALLEDLAFGLDHARREYVDKSLAGLAWLFADEERR